MKNFTRIFLAALALLAVCAPIAYSDDDDGHPAHSDLPTVTAKPAAPVWDSSARLRAVIDPEVDGVDEDGSAATATYSFQFGPTAAYGLVTPAATLSGDNPVSVAVQVSGLKPETVYHFRAVATNASGTTYGPDRKFTTLRKTSAGGEGSGGEKGASQEPALGRTVVARAAAGEVLVREHGESEFHPIDGAEKLPVDSTFDTREGTVKLKTALAGGDTQTGTFRGGLFKVRQSRSGNGMTNIALRGGSFAACGSGPASRARATFRRRSPVRKLWAKDRGGKFKTSGKGSVATVRGTSWYTADRCDGTLTKVKHGAVLVREKGTGRSRLLHKGQSFLARIKR